MAKDGKGQDLCELFLRENPDGRQLAHRVVIFRSNYVSFNPNDLVDDKSIVAEDEFLFYPCRIEIAPDSPLLPIATQVGLAKYLKEFLESNGVDAVICADFDELM